MGRFSYRIPIRSKRAKVNKKNWIKRRMKKRIQNNSDAKDKANIGPKRTLEEDIVKVELEEEIVIKDEVAMDDCCGESTNMFSDFNAQMTDVKEVELCEDSKLNITSQELETNCLGSTFDPGTKSMKAVNSSNTQEKGDTIVNVGNVVARLVPKKSLVTEKKLEFDQSEKASSSEDLTNITVFIETVDGENEREKSLEAKIECLKYYIRKVKIAAKNQENQLVIDNTVLASKLKAKDVCINNLKRENQILINEFYYAKQDHHIKIENMLKAMEKLKAKKPNDLKGSDKQLKQETNECLDHANSRLNLWQELADVKVKLTNCSKEKVKLEKDLRLFKKKLHDMNEYNRVMAIKENEMVKEIQTMKGQLENALKVCSLVGVSSTDIMNLDKVKKQILKSKAVLLPKNWKVKIKANFVRELEKKTEECTQLKKELDKLKNLDSDNVCRLSNVCEYCGM